MMIGRSFLSSPSDPLIAERRQCLLNAPLASESEINHMHINADTWRFMIDKLPHIPEPGASAFLRYICAVLFYAEPSSGPMECSFMAQDVPIGTTGRERIAERC